MALEAARQLSHSRKSDTGSVRLSNVELKQQLPLSVFIEADTVVEAQLIARQLDGTNMFSFEIFSQNAADENSWVRHCAGNFETRLFVEPSFLSPHDEPFDEVLMDQVQALEPSVVVDLSGLKLGPEGSSGEFERKVDDVGSYDVHPSTLNSILRLPPMSLLNRNVLAEHRLSSLASISVPNQPQRSQCGRFIIRVKSSRFCHVESDIDISQSGYVISLEGLQYQPVKVVHRDPVPNSLFFKPILVTDITTLAAAVPMTFSRCAELLTHKWPMCDIKISGVPERRTLSILEAFGATRGEKRLYFRSIKYSSVPPGAVSDRVQLVDGSDITSKYHVIITGDAPSEVQLNNQLHPRGFLCIPKTQMGEPKSKETAPLEVICEITGLGQDPWVLLRKSSGPSLVCADRRAVIFTNDHVLRSLKAFERMEFVALEPAAVARFCKLNNYASFDAIITECPEKSVISMWTGSELMPWLQDLLKSADSVLWVTRSRSGKPFANLAGSLLRTLQSEQPSLKISWLVTDDMATEHRDAFASKIEQAYVRMVEGGNELVTRTGQLGLEILRYLPDDDLSADTGLSFPQKERRPLGEADYSLDYAAPGEPVLLTHHPRSTPALNGDTIEVLVQTSVVGMDDLRMFNPEAKVEVSRPHSGLFFAGKVSNSQDSGLPPECCVVGWHPNDTHRKKISVWAHNVRLYPSSMQPSQVALRYGATAVAWCIVDGAARARPRETFRLELEGPLLNAVKQVCKHLGATVLQSCSVSKADFVVTFKCVEGICVNDQPINLASYMQSDHGRAMVQRTRQETVDLSFQFDEYEIAEYEEAFKNAKQPFSAVLLHRNTAKIIGHVPIYKNRADMFTGRANYIVIGGLGGLGRFICSWMIENGAKHITVISRSGAGTPEAREAMSDMKAAGASIHCIKADACDRKAIAEILAKARSEYPIKGVINLAMVLGDAPMATMAADEWDRGFRVKVDSSWILHEETLQDRLDFFILFSSIASVLGNRSQGNYNVSNTFLNVLAEYRQSLDLPGISVALGAMSKSSG